ncbi:MAG: hypothetical protein WC096_00615 [Sphaerochaetaceae bacterium]
MQSEFENITLDDMSVDRFADGDSVPMRIDGAEYKDEYDIYEISLMELGTESPRYYTDTVFMRFKNASSPEAKHPHAAGDPNPFSVSKIRGLSKKLYDVDAWVTPDKLIGAVIGVHFRVGKYTDIDYYQLPSSFAKVSRCEVPQIYKE